jgi:hypothetical protein
MKLTHNSALPSTRFTTYLACDLAQQVSLHTFDLHYIYHDKWINKFYLKNDSCIAAYIKTTWNERKILDVIFFEENVRYPDSLKKYMLSFVGDRLEIPVAVKEYELED